MIVYSQVDADAMFAHIISGNSPLANQLWWDNKTFTLMVKICFIITFMMALNI